MHAQTHVHTLAYAHARTQTCTHGLAPDALMNTPAHAHTLMHTHTRGRHRCANAFRHEHPAVACFLVYHNSHSNTER